MKIFFYNALIISLCICLTACTSSSSRKIVSSVTPKNITTSLKKNSFANRASELLNQSIHVKGSASKELQLKAASLLLDGELSQKAQMLLAAIDTKGFGLDITVKHRLLRARLALLQKRPQHALNLLKTVHIKGLSANKRVELHKIKAAAYSRDSNNLEAARELVKLDSLLNIREQAKNQQRIWNTLRSLTLNILNTVNYTPDHNNQFEGWLRLVKITKSYNTYPQQLITELKKWYHDFPNHPGRKRLPGFQALALDTPVRPKKIALLLPFSGKLAPSAKAIQTGFLSAYYSDCKKYGIPPPELFFIDTFDDQRVNQAYEKALQTNVEFIVGPLTKKGVKEIAKNKLSIPVLALNKIVSSNKLPKKLYQFGLLPELEASSIANRAWQDGYRQALVLLPDSDWGQRLLNTFQNDWQELGGKIAGSKFFKIKDDLSKVVRELLMINKSQQRRRGLERLLGKKINFQPRRRDDGDFIFLATTPEHARQLKPLLNFYFAKNLPVYATSSVYSGKVNAMKDQDLNQLIFCDQPWVLDNYSLVKNKRQELLTLTTENITLNPRLLALGMDAYKITHQLNHLLAFPELGTSGMTGMLKLTITGDIQRHLLWAKFIKGVPRILAQNNKSI